ncbi:hypothetical protein BaRGS_00010653, partial [Batillaria attramentaria]
VTSKTRLQARLLKSFRVTRATGRRVPAAADMPLLSLISVARLKFQQKLIGHRSEERSHSESYEKRAASQDAVSPASHSKRLPPIMVSFTLATCRLAKLAGGSHHRHLSNRGSNSAPQCISGRREYYEPAGPESFNETLS